MKLLGDETVAPLQIVLNTDNGQMLKQAVEDNHVLTFCTALSVTYGQSTLDLQKVRLIPLKEKLQISYLVVRSNQHVNKYIENLLIQKMRDFFGYWMRQTKGE